MPKNLAVIASMLAATAAVATVYHLLLTEITSCQREIHQLKTDVYPLAHPVWDEHE